MTKLKKLHDQPDKSDYLWNDSLRIVRLFFEVGIECSPVQACKLWMERSNAWDASWYGLPDDDSKVLDDIYEYCYIEIVHNYRN